MKLGIMAGYSGATGRDLHGARYSADTKWPEGFDPKAAGAWLVEDGDEPAAGTVEVRIG